MTRFISNSPINTTRAAFSCLFILVTSSSHNSLFLPTFTGVLAIDSGVQEISAEDFGKKFQRNDNKPMLVEFYSNMCGSCTAFKSTLSAIATDPAITAKSIPTYTISIDEPSGMTLAHKEGALEDGLPSLKLYVKQESTSIVNGNDYPDKFPDAKVFVKSITNALGGDDEL